MLALSRTQIHGRVFGEILQQQQQQPAQQGATSDTCQLPTRRQSHRTPRIHAAYADRYRVDGTELVIIPVDLLCWKR